LTRIAQDSRLEEKGTLAPINEDRIHGVSMHACWLPENRLFYWRIQRVRLWAKTFKG